MIAKIGLVIIVIFLLIVFIPTLIVDNFVSKHFYSNFSTLSPFTYQFTIDGNHIRLNVENDNDDYWENIGARFFLFDELGLPVLNTQGACVVIDI